MMTVQCGFQAWGQCGTLHGEPTRIYRGPFHHHHNFITIFNIIIVLLAPTGDMIRQYYSSKATF